MGFAARLLNCYSEGSNETRKALEQDLDVVVISTTFTWCPQIRPVVSAIRKAHPNVKIIIGGRWVYDSYRVLLKSREPGNDFSDEVLERYFFTGKSAWEDVDLFIVGEHGEDILEKALDSVIGADDIHELDNCAYWEDGNLIFTPRVKENFDVSNLAIDWTSLPEKYQSSVMPLVAGIGCPFRCKFCDYSLNTMYYKPFDLLRKELRKLDACRFVSTLGSLMTIFSTARNGSWSLLPCGKRKISI